ncbi:MAG: two pore domain potassium channel family protein [Anaerolineales bacterium]|nr:two pore domain potassium channel family protein [Anaerolineales bacterium]MCB9146462.1 two pore domain potassium channel family protein [Anaerolineales bacterium]
MPAFFILIYRFFRTIWHGMQDRDFRALLYWVLGIIGMGTWFYSKVEGWRVLDSLYFTVITLTTVGYGDFSPKTDAGKIFTMVYIFVGIGLLSGFIFLLGERSGFIKPSARQNEEKEER